MLTKLKNIDNKKFNDCLLVTNIIRREGPLTKQQIIDKTGYKLTTLARIIDWLLQNEIICINDTDISTGGRKPARYKLNPHAGYIIGIDIARMYTKVALVDLDYNIVKLVSFGMFEESTWEITHKKITDIIADFSKDIDKEKIIGIGVGAVGPIDKLNGILINPVNFPSSGWNNINIKKSLEESTGFQVVIENGVNAAVLAEYNSTYYKNYSSIVYINAGVGLRLGLITRSGIPENSYSNEEGFGHMTVDIGGKSCHCGNKGCIETYVSIPAILDSYKNELKKGQHSTILDKINFDLSAISFDMFCEEVEAGDYLAESIVNKAAEYFASALSNTINLINPEVVILGGPLIKKCKKFYDLSIFFAKEKINKCLAPNIIFSLGQLGENAVNIGAANIALDHFLGT